MTILNILLLVMQSFSAPPPIIWGCSQGAQLLTPGLCDNQGNPIGGTSDHGALSGLSDDDHGQYCAINGRSGGQTIIGGTGASENLTLKTTSNATKGKIYFGDTSGDMVFSDTLNALAIGQEEFDVTINGTSYSAKAVVDTAGASDLAGLYEHRHSDSANLGGHFLFSRSRGTHDSETVVQNGDQLARIVATGFDGTDYERGASVEFEVDGTPGGGDMPGRILLRTTGDASTSLQTRLTIAQDGLVTVNNEISAPINGTSNECFGANTICGNGGGSSGYNTAIGSAAVAGNDVDGVNATTIGAGANCGHNDSVCIGRSSTSSGASSVQIGSSSTATANGVAIGTSQTCDGSKATCIGFDADCGGSNSVCLGANADVATGLAGVSGISIGNNATANDSGSSIGFGISIGDGASSTWGYGMAIGRSATTAYSSIALFRNATTTAHNQFVIGGNSAAIKDIWIGESVTDGTSNPISINSTERTGTNVAGNSMTFKTRGTGTGEGGDFIFTSGVPGASGSTAHTQVELMRLDTQNHYVGIGQASPATRLELEETKTLTSSPSDGYASSLTIDPGYSGSYTVTRHNYLDLQNPSLSSTTLTDACVMRFDAAAGTHKAVDSGSTKTTPGTVDAWIKVNINGTIYYVPAYTSKTN